MARDSWAIQRNIRENYITAVVKYDI
jgi:hypothetical protein